jgi:aminoglycoside phosphotransferase (APT) family kinase protein
MPEATQTILSAQFMPLSWLRVSSKGILTIISTMGLLWAMSWAIDSILGTEYCNNSVKDGRYVGLGHKWRNAKQSINLEKLKTIALRLRTGNHPGEVSQPSLLNLTCEVQDAYLGGSYNFFFYINFSDGVTWLARIAGYSGLEEDREMQKHLRDHQTLALLRKSTALPLPAVFFWEPSTKSIGRSFALLSCLSGERLFNKWFHGTWATEEKRLKILTQIAEAMAQLGKWRFKEVGGLLFNESGDPVKIGPTYEYRKMQDETPEIFSYGPWRTYQHYQREKEGRMSQEINAWGKLDRKVILMASRSIPNFMYGDGTYLAHPDFNLQNILVDDDAKVTGIIDWDNTWTPSRSTGYASFPMWLTQEWDPAIYFWGNQSDSSLEALRPFQSRPDDLQRWRKHYSTVFLNKWTEYLDGDSLITESILSRTSCRLLTMRFSARLAAQRLCGRY